METLLLSKHNLQTLVARVGLSTFMSEMIDRLTHTLINFDEVHTIVPQRSGFNYQVPYPGVLEWMTVMQAGKSAHVKVVGYNPSNPSLRNLPTILSCISVYDIQSGHLIGIADGTFLTALRTGAASAIASRVLALPESKTLGLIGCGAQAITQLHALSLVFPLKKIRIFDINDAIAGDFLKRAAWLKLNIEPAPLPELVAESDIICTATSVEVGRGPVFADRGLRPWVHINAVGSDFPGKTEVPYTVLQRSLVCPDFTLQAVVEGECQQLKNSEIGPTLSEVVKKADKFSSACHRMTVFDSTGYALEDQAAMELLLNYAHEFGIGNFVQIECTTGEVHDPYAFVRSSDSSETDMPQTEKVVAWAD